MAVRPKRKNPMSTRPVYLPRVPAKELREAAKARTPIEGSCLRIYADGALGDLDIKGLARQLSDSEGRAATVEGELVAILVGRPQTEVRDTVASVGHRLAWARIGDPAKQEYRVLPQRGEVDQEEAQLRGRSQPEYEGIQRPSAPTDVLYDGAEVQAAYRELMPQESEDDDVAYVIVTDRRLGRWDAKAKMWTPLRVIAGVPLVVSVGSEEGPIDADALLEEIRRAHTELG